MYLKVIEWMSYTIFHKRTTYLQHVAMDKDLSFKYAVATYFKCEILDLGNSMLPRNLLYYARE